MKQINNYETLGKYFKCDTCQLEFTSFAPSLKVSSKNGATQDNLTKGQCLVSPYPMLFNCDNSSKDHVRLCPCSTPKDVTTIW